MLKIKEIADNLGLSKPQTRRRINAIKDLLNEDSIKRGDHNEILLSQDALHILKQVEQYRKQGDTTRKAKEKIKQDLGLQSDDQTRQTEPVNDSESYPSNSHQTSLNLVKEQYERRLEEKDNLINELKRDKRRLEERNDNLEQQLLTGKVEKKSPVIRFWEWLGL